jgi:peptidoglycan LD-endopeptidase LytH
VRTSLGLLAAATALALTASPFATATAGPTVPSGIGVTGSVHRSAHPQFTYRFPVKGCHVSYSHYHHDYPATDIFAARGCRFVSPINGTVDEVSRHDHWSPSTNKGSQRGGLFVSVIGVDGVRYYGSHLEKVAPGIKPGVTVKRGQVLGRIGNSGDARGIATQVHFGISWTTPHHIWWIRRGVIYPWPYLDAWRAGHLHKSPVAAIRRALHKAGKRVPPCTADC